MLTPQKVAILTEMFTERLNSITMDDIQRDIRRKKAKTHIKDAIANINKTTAGKTAKKIICANLTERQKFTFISVTFYFDLSFI